MKVFSLDAGRKYFSENQIKELIDTISSRGFTHLHLLIGNDGLRLQLDNLELGVNGKQYSHEEVKNAIHYGNEEYFKLKSVTNTENKELTQDEMNRIFEYAKTKNIEIIPGFNTPGHMDAILSAMEKLGLQDVRFVGSNGAKSKTTLNLTNQDARTFTQALFKKYVQYFASKGAKIVNFGADEYANDLGFDQYGGFKALHRMGLYGTKQGFVGYVNEVSKIIKDASMRPMAFNDGIYYNAESWSPFEVSEPFDTSIIISYWIAGYWGYDVSSANYLKQKGFDILNTSDGWYYVIGLEDESDSRTSGNPYNRQKALTKMTQPNFKFDKHSVKQGQRQVDTIGSMVAVWSDYPGKAYEKEKVNELINTFADQNEAYFKKASTPEVPKEDKKLMSVLSLDAGRKYFSVVQLKEIITSLSDLGYTHLHLLFANDGMRFLLNDLQLDVNNEVYSSEQVKEALIAGNADYAKAITKHKSLRIPENEDKYLTEQEMDELLGFAKSKNVKIIPGLNSPGHMDSIVFAMEKLGINDAFFTHNGRKSRTTLNFKNDKTIAFTKALVQKYVEYFKTKKELGVEMFNFGADEYGQDITYHVNNGPSGFSVMQSEGLYNKFTQYVNDLAQIIKTNNLKPVAFNDGFYYNNVEPNQKFDTDIIVAYWNAGFDRYSLASARKLRDKGHQILNTNDAWYYVLGLEYGGWYGLPYATENMAKPQHKFDKVTGDNTNVDTIGSMVAIWADNPARTYRFSNLERLIKTFKAYNPGFIKKEEIKLGKSVTLKFETKEGQKLAEPIIVVDEGQPIGTKYDANQLLKLSLTNQSGILYANPILKQNSAQLVGNVTEEEQVITLVYSTVPGEKVTVRYEDKNGKELKVTEFVAKGQSVGTPYDYQNKVEVEVKDEQGLVYGNPKHKEGSAPESGRVSKNVQEIVYVYELQKGSEVIVKFVDEKGNSIIEDEELIPAETARGTKYDYTSKIRREITNDKGLVFELVVNENQEPILQEGSALVRGEVSGKIQRIVFVYKAKLGKPVIVKYEDNKGKTLKEFVAVQDQTQIGTKYDVTSLLEKEITVDESKYVLPKLKENSDLEKGTVSEEAKTVTYVYEKLNDKQPLTAEVEKEDEVLKDVKYTEASVEKQEAYKQALSKAKEVLIQFNPSEDQLEEALTNLSKAKAQLDGVAYEIKTLTDNKHFVENVKVKPTTSLSVKAMDKNRVEALKEKDVILYDITFNDAIKGSGINIGEGDYTVHLAVDGNKEVSSVYYVSETGELESLAFTKKENEVIFKTTHFSLYAVEFKATSTVQPKVEDTVKSNPNIKKDADTSDSSNIGFTTVIGMISLLGLTFLSRKRNLK